MNIFLIAVGTGIIVFAFYQMIFGGSAKHQDSVPPMRIGGGNGGLPY